MGRKRGGEGRAIQVVHRRLLTFPLFGHLGSSFECGSCGIKIIKKRSLEQNQAGFRRYFFRERGLFEENIKKCWVYKLSFKTLSLAEFKNQCIAGLPCGVAEFKNGVFQRPWGWIGRLTRTTPLCSDSLILVTIDVID